MKKIKGFQAQVNQITDTIDALEQFFLDISSDDVKPGRHANTVKEILALPMPPPEKTCDEEMVKELNRLCLGSDEVVGDKQ
jgi:hypothetical protein